MGIPSGFGSEITYRGTVNAQSSSQTAFRWDKTNPTTGTDSYTVPSDHIITVISITFCEIGGQPEVIYLNMNDGTNQIQIFDGVSLPANGTFVWNDRVVLVGGDKMQVNCASTANVDILYTFVDQNWDSS
jgi:hypothetical protein